VRIFKSQFFDGFSISVESPEDLEQLKKLVPKSRMTVNVRKPTTQADLSQIEAFLEGNEEKEGEL